MQRHGWTGKKKEFDGRVNAAGPVRILGPDGSLSKVIWPDKFKKRKFDKKGPFIKKVRERLVRNSTRAEDLLHDSLRERLRGLWGKKKVYLKFQHIITCRGGKRYIVDFFIERVGLCVEVDGGYHDTPEQREADRDRTKILEFHGYRVIRFTNQEVFDDVGLVVDRIIDCAKKMRWS